MAAATAAIRQQSAGYVAPARPAAPAVGFGNASLYVGDLEASVSEEHLFDLFNQVAPVLSVRVCKDLNSLGRVSLGYGYVNFSTPQDAAHAMEVLNFTPVNGKPIRIMLSHRDPSIRKSGHANVFIKNLDRSIDNKALHDTFATFGTILSCKVALDSSGQSKGYGFVQFDKEEAAGNAIKSLNGMLLNDKQVYVGLFIRRQERYQGNGCPKFTNVYVKNLPDSIHDEELKKLFAPFGAITSSVVMKDASGKSKCFGFVNFENPDSAAAAVEKLNGSTHDEKVLYVGRAQKKAEREAELKAKYEQERISRYEKLQGANLYMKNLDESVNDEKLKELFSEFGNVASCKVMIDAQGASKGSGFVAFSTPEESARALKEMNGKMVGRKPLYVAVAQRKEERKARLQVKLRKVCVSHGLSSASLESGVSSATTSLSFGTRAHFALLRAPGGMSPVSPGMSGFHAGAPRIGPQQLYYGQSNPGLIPPQPTGYGFQQHFLPGIRPSVAPNYMIPYPPSPRQQGPFGQRVGMRRGGNVHKFQHQQMTNRNPNQGFRTVNARNSIDPPAVPQGLVGSAMIPTPFEGSPMPVNPTDIGRPPSSSVLMSALRSASLKHQRIILGEHLYPLVAKIEQEGAAKVTGMLLEMDQPEVLHLIEAPDALKKKVAEALEVLRQAARSSTLEPDANGVRLSSLPATN